ncbi:ECF family RNA polymerase sigma factor [Rhodopirellula maiorica SM1]|uniref:ECF family RNA polymerase sigma factor n=1 Tax=Rhodopirellula maiorica SM1 TaxID=1265738 RepID=M5RRS7_9BACT|nr:sigma-70 family RNA polymerase sigma factor [Rhodopirellula maiorica]EMI22048.1 ECF family RNA polymerase sigma factor [Rhodopirellula maiorica SM1]
MPDHSPNQWPAETISALVDRFERPLLAYASRMLGGDWQEAQDAVQETFLRLCREDREKIESRVAAWLFSVCRSRVIDMQRTKHSTPIDASKVSLADPAPDVSEVASDEEARHRLTEMVDQLSPRQQEVLRLRMQAGLSYREIAEVTGLTVSNVGFHLHEAVRNLRNSLAMS